MIKSDNERLFSGFMSDKLLRVATFLPSSCLNLDLPNREMFWDFFLLLSRPKRFLNPTRLNELCLSPKPIRTISNGKHNNYDLPRHIGDVFLHLESLINHTRWRRLSPLIFHCVLSDFKTLVKIWICNRPGDDFSSHLRYIVVTNWGASERRLKRDDSRRQVLEKTRSQNIRWINANKMQLQS